MARLVMWLWERLFLRLQIFVGVIGALCLVLTVVSFNAERVEQQLDYVSETTMKKQALVERVNGLVYAVVMESRGLYMADTPDKIERFGKGLEAHLASLETTRKEWKALVEPADTKDFEAFEKNADVFTRLRRELVAEARAKGAPGARAVGDNEANRSTRTAFNKSLEALAVTYKARIVEIEAQNEAKHFWVSLINRSILGAVVLMALVGWAWLQRYMSQPFNDISEALRRINVGDTAFQVQHQARVDEVGGISRAIETFRQQSIQRGEIERVKSEESARKAERQARFEQAISAFESAATVRVESVAKTANDLHHASGVLSSSAEEAARQVHIVTEHSDEMATNISSLSHIGDQLVHAIGEIAEGMGRASDVSQQASSLSTETATKFTDLEQAVAAITDVVDIINQIAGQTNLLALNATIEAARAGEAGRGFAVVAAEVKQLAAQTTRATADISANVSHVQAVAGDSIAAVEAIGGIIEDMRRIAIEVTSSVEEQRVATQSIASSVRAAANGTQAVTDNIAGVAKAAEETGAASVQLLSSAGKLAGEASGIKGEVERFLTTIRAA